MRRIKLTIAYDGTDYHGWQVQSAVPTIQATIEAALFDLENAPVRIEGSGRTDAGVHALAQVASFSLINPIPPANLVRVLNRTLPPAIRILNAAEVPAEFHARFSAVAKTYQYRILRGEICPPSEHRYVFHHPYPLDEARMLEAAPLLEGEHDFTSFAAADESDQLGRSKIRTIFSSQLTRDGGSLLYRVRGNGFLKHMVRNIVGVLLEVGKGNIAPAAILDPRNPGPTVPGRGLFLVSVEYR